MAERRELPGLVESLEHSRRRFLAGTLATAGGALLGGGAGLAVGQSADPTAPKRKIKVGLVGCGGRGGWIAGFFKEHGGYEFVAVADYFQPVADQCGDALGVDKARRFSGLSGYQKVIESGIEAVILQTPPCFFQEHATAAAAGGLHVYMAKPVAVDVPGCLKVGAAAKQASEKKKVFFVDYQMPTEPINIEVADRVRKGEIGKLLRIHTEGVCGGHDDPPKTATVESRIHNNVWDNDVAIGGSFITVFDIHALDAAIWLLGKRPVAATGTSRICRNDPHGDAHDMISVLFEYADGLIHEHSGMAIPNGTDGELSCRAYGEKGHAVINYWRKAHFHRRGQKELTAEVIDLYPVGAKRNVASFYRDVTEDRLENPTVQRALDGCLTCILGREAALRNGRMTMEELLKENRRVELDLSGLKM